MQQQRPLRKQHRAGLSPVGGMPAAGAIALSAALVFQGCFAPAQPNLDREARVMEALDDAAARDALPNPLTPTRAVAYALAHNLDAKVAEIEAAYQNESLVAARRKLLPGLTLRYSPNYTNHPAARWSESTESKTESLESSYSSEQYTRQSEVGMVWNLIDFGVGYLRARQQGERILHADQQRRRVRQQVVLNVLSHYWRAAAAERIAAEAESLRARLSAILSNCGFCPARKGPGANWLSTAVWPSWSSTAGLRRKRDWSWRAFSAAAGVRSCPCPISPSRLSASPPSGTTTPGCCRQPH